jgi:putative DNA primase/helicase
MQLKSYGSWPKLRHSLYANRMMGLELTGTGKTLLVDVISIIARGTPSTKCPQNVNHEEERKRMLAFALAVTGGVVADRSMGTHDMATAPWVAHIFATGNNILFAGDTVRRTVLIDLDPKMERPEERQGSRHPRLLAWVKKERPRLLVAALTLVKAYFDAGLPNQGLPLIL